MVYQAKANNIKFMQSLGIYLAILMILLNYFKTSILHVIIHETFYGAN